MMPRKKKRKIPCLGLVEFFIFKDKKHRYLCKILPLNKKEKKERNLIAFQVENDSV